jgi:hypothetical protein
MCAIDLHPDVVLIISLEEHKENIYFLYCIVCIAVEIRT